MELQETPTGKVAYEFADALRSGLVEIAYQLLSSSAREVWSLTDLQDTYEEMIKNLDAGPVEFINISEVVTDWPDKQAQDLGWAYVAIACDGDSEAIIVTICDEGGRQLIRDIEWGRP